MQQHSAECRHGNRESADGRPQGLGRRVRSRVHWQSPFESSFAAPRALSMRHGPTTGSGIGGDACRDESDKRSQIAVAGDWRVRGLIRQVGGRGSGSLAGFCLLRPTDSFMNHTSAIDPEDFQRLLSRNLKLPLAGRHPRRRGLRRAHRLSAVGDRLGRAHRPRDPRRKRSPAPQHRSGNRACAAS